MDIDIDTASPCTRRHVRNRGRGQTSNQLHRPAASLMPTDSNSNYSHLPETNQNKTNARRARRIRHVSGHLRFLRRGRSPGRIRPRSTGRRGGPSNMAVAEFGGAAVSTSIGAIFDRRRR